MEPLSVRKVLTIGESATRQSSQQRNTILEDRTDRRGPHLPDGKHSFGHRRAIGRRLRTSNAVLHRSAARADQAGSGQMMPGEKAPT